MNNRDTLTTSRPTFAAAQTNFNYGYDDLDRLITATRPITGDPDETFTYDPVGNRLQRDGDIVDNTFDVANRLLEDANFTYTYDDNGNTTSKTDKATSEVIEYNYDPQNRLIGFVERVIAGGAITKTVSYKYDASGRRIQKNVDGIITSYIYDGKDILFEYDGASMLQARYTHGPRTDEPLVMERSGQAYCYHADGLGSFTELSDSVGSTIQSYLYDSFGNITQTTGVLENPFTYTGRELDTESGLYYYRARYYDPNTGRILKEDPIGFAGLDINLYAYVANNPVNFIDPSGNTKDKDDKNKDDDFIIDLGNLPQPEKDTKEGTEQPVPFKVPKRGKGCLASFLECSFGCLAKCKNPWITLACNTFICLPIYALCEFATGGE